MKLGVVGGRNGDVFPETRCDCVQVFCKNL